MHLLKAFSKDNQPIIAKFNPQVGMNLMSFTWGDFEIIDQCTSVLFNERCAGLGALIGPHFHHRKEGDIPNIEVSSLFPFTKHLLLNGQKEPFSHGIARYVPWNYKGDATSIFGTLNGSDEYQGIKLAALEGQDFTLEYQATITSEGLDIEYQVNSKKPSVIGLHYYYSLPGKQGEVFSRIDPMYHDFQGWKKVPHSWYHQLPNKLGLKVASTFDADFGFRPWANQLSSTITLKTSKYCLHITYQANSEENAWQLYHPKDATFVCIEPVSAKNPREAKKTFAHLKINIQVENLG